jgi:DMSO/TMAO reductase YedYZ molybdopterin-dependent catalytic subunit
MSQKPSWLTGALAGALLTAPLLAIIYLGQRLAGLPFLPADFFNPVRDFTPGGIVIFTIQRMVDAIIALNLGRVDEVAKTVETLMASGLVLIIGIVSGIIFFRIFNTLERSMLRTAGIIGGLVVGVPMALISLQFGLTNTIDPRIIGAIWLIALFVVWGVAHAWVYEKLTQPAAQNSAASAQALNRRQFLITVGAASATFTVVGAGLGALLRRTDVTPTETALAGAEASGEAAALPNADDPVQPAPGTRPEVTPLADHYRIDISLIPPTIAEATWVLPFTSKLGGSDERLAEFTLDELKAYEAREDYITMSCISNRLAGDLISTIKWTGVSLQRVLQDVEVPEGATHLRITAADGFDETVALDVVNGDERVMLAYYWEDQPLTSEHGFPIRIHIPDHFGMKQPKWITGIEFLSADQDGYWVRRGWDKEARVRATSVIDTIATDMMVVDGDQSLIPIGGIAWAGARGISAVEIRIDEGDWQPTQLRAPISDRTWTIWRYDWAFTQGDHTFEVRCIEADGTPQIEESRGVQPSGATGIHSMSAMI